MLNMLDLASRLEELKLGVRKEVQDMKLPNWSENIDDELKAGMIMAEREVLKSLKLLGMLPALVKGNILKSEVDDIINMNTPELGAFVVWDAPDENEVISSEELFDLDNEVLLTAIEDHSNNHCSTFVDLAAMASLETDQDGADEDDEEDSPTRSFYKDKKCKYLDKSFKPPKNTRCIGCSYPSCNAWYNSICNSQQTKKDKIYTLICLTDNNIREHFRNKLAALASDKHSLVDENDVSLESLPKRLRVSKKSTSAKHQTDYSIRPNYVEHEGQYYHSGAPARAKRGRSGAPWVRKFGKLSIPENLVMT